MNTVARMAENRFAIIAIALFVTSCAQIVKVHTPAASFMTAETSGKSLGGKFLIAAQSGTEGTLVLESDEIENPLELRSNVTPINLGLDLGVIEKVDFFLRSPMHEGPSQIGAKFQLFGDARAKAKKGNHSFAIAFSGGSAESTEISDDFLDGDSDSDFEADTVQGIYETSLLYSYRTEEDTLVYTGLRISKNELKVDVNKASDEEIEGKSVDYQSTSVTANVGIMRYFPNMFTSLEASVQQTNWTNNDPTSFVLIAGALGWHWE